jgi:hypothetical protein
MVAGRFGVRNAELSAGPIGAEWNSSLLRPGAPACDDRPAFSDDVMGVDRNLPNTASRFADLGTNTCLISDVCH